MWQAVREKHQDKNFELVTVGLDALGQSGCRPFIEAAEPKHPALIDEHHILANLYGIVNIPQAIWIDENFNIVRPVEGAPPPPSDQAAQPPELPADIPQRMIDIMTEASKIQADPESYHQALEDWLVKGSASEFALTADEVIARSTPRDYDNALGHAHFELATELELQNRHDLAVPHFREAHRLVPNSWTFRRQAWSLETVGDGPFARFWQGPNPETPDSWPYDGDWLEDIRKEGAENYYKQWNP